MNIMILYLKLQVMTKSHLHGTNNNEPRTENEENLKSLNIKCMSMSSNTINQTGVVEH